MVDKNERHQNEEKWHHLKVEEVIERLDINSAEGLSKEEANYRLKQYGANEIFGKKKKNVFLKFLDNFKQPLIYILLIAATVSLAIGKTLDAVVIYGVAFLNALVGFIQESKAQQAIEALAKTIVTNIVVIRNGDKEKISSRYVVPGDIILLSSGDKVPADLRLIESRNLEINESALTGESVPVQKDTFLVAKDAVITDQNNMAFAGTLVTRGSGKGIVVKAGTKTETGRISKMMKESEGLETPLTRKIQKFSKTLLYIIITLSGLLFLLAFFKGLPWTSGFQAAVALSVSAIPEGLPAAVTVTLAIGVSRMAKQNAIIRKLPAVETMGSTTVICSDKTGTLTQNKMTVENIFAGNELYEVINESNEKGKIRKKGEKEDSSRQFALKECLLTGLLCNDSHLSKQDGELIAEGDPTEGALLMVAHKVSMDKDSVEKKYPRIDTIPFESKKQYMATLNKNISEGSANTILLKGSVDAVLKRCKKAIDSQGKKITLDIEEIKNQTALMAKKGLRVLGFAKKEIALQKQNMNDSDLESGMIFLGLMGMIDPPRPEAIEAIKTAQKAGIKIKMITGDHLETAKAIAIQMGIIEASDENIYSGKELSSMSDEEFASASQAKVFARVAPEHKLRLVKHLQAEGEIVAVTGDGVNDSPALSRADIGIAMGMMGTEVAKESADMVLADDNFASIEAAVEEGRTVYSNLLKTIKFILPVNGGESLIIFAGLLFLAIIPILPIQILWINMISSLTLMLTLAFEPKHMKTMNQPPRDPTKGLLSKGLMGRVMIISLFNVLAILIGFEFIFQTTENITLARTIAVNTLVAAETFYFLSISRFIPSVFDHLKDRSVKIAYVPAIGILCLLILQYMFTQLGVMNTLFHTQPLSVMQFLLCIGLGLVVFVPALLLNRYRPVDHS